MTHHFAAQDLKNAFLTDAEFYFFGRVSNICRVILYKRKNIAVVQSLLQNRISQFTSDLLNVDFTYSRVSTLNLLRLSESSVRRSLVATVSLSFVL